MTDGRVPADSLDSAFVTEMRAALMEFCAASTPAQKGRVESEMLEIMRRHFGPEAWRSHQRGSIRVPRATTRPRAPFDRKMAAAGPETD